MTRKDFDKIIRQVQKAPFGKLHLEIGQKGEDKILVTDNADGTYNIRTSEKIYRGVSPSMFLAMMYFLIND